MALTDIHADIAGERHDIADFFDSLNEEQAATESLCGGWTAKDVAGHLVATLTTPIPQVVLGVIRRGGNINGHLFDEAKRAAEDRTMAELAGLIRTHADKRFKPPGFGYAAPLTDVIVHSIDVRRPLGMTRVVPGDRLRTALDFTAGISRGGFGGRKRLRGLRVEATDVDWARGGGPIVRSTGLALLMTMGGRAGFADELEGDGAAILRSRLGR